MTIRLRKSVLDVQNLLDNALPLLVVLLHLAVAFLAISRLTMR